MSIARFFLHRTVKIMLPDYQTAAQAHAKESYVVRAGMQQQERSMLKRCP